MSERKNKSQLSLAVLQIQNFRYLLSIRTFGMMALQAQAVIVGWQIYSLTKDLLLLGLIGLVEAIPAIGCALFAGHVVDNSSPRLVLRLCFIVLAVNTLMLYAIGGGHVPVPETYVVPALFLGVFMSGLARSFIIPASFSLLPQVVPRTELPAASAWLGSGFQVAAIGGPAIAGFIYGQSGPGGAWIMPAVLMAFAFLIAMLVDVPHRKVEKRAPAVESIKEGWSFLMSKPVLLSVMALDMFAVLFGGAVAMLPAYADQVLHTDAEGVGILRAAPAMGAIVTAIFLALWPLKILSAKRLLLVVAGFGVCMIGFGLSKIFWLSVVLLALSGAFDSVSMVIRGTMMQLLTPDTMRGRVSSVNSMFVISSNEIGAFRSGVSANFLGLVPSVVLGGIATLIVVGFTAFISPQFRKTVIRTDEPQA